MVVLFTTQLFAQQKIQSTIINEATHEVVPGVVVKNTKTNESVMTDINGWFEIKIQNNEDVLNIKDIRFETLEITAKNVKKNTALSMHAEQLNQVIVSASRTKENKHDVPVAISSITKKTLTELKPNDVSEVLNQKPGVHMVDLGNEQHMLAIRQPITTKSVFLFLEDGLPIRPTGIFNHNALLELNSEALETIEIIRGAYSSLYGSEAIGGAINYVTEKPSATLTGNVSARINDIGYKRFGAKISNTVGKTGIYFAGYHSRIDDGFRAYGDFKKYTGTLKVNHQFSDQLFLDNTLTVTDYKSDTSGSLSKTAFEDKDYSSNHTFTYRDAYALRLTSSLRYLWNDDHQSTLKFFYRDNALGQNPTYRISNRSPLNAVSKTGEINENSFESFGALLQHDAKISDQFKFNAGGVIDFSKNDFFAEELEVFRNSKGVFESFEQLGTFKVDYQTDLLNIGGFVAGEYKLNEYLRLNGGLRLDGFLYDFTNKKGAGAADFKAPNTEKGFVSFTPRIGLVYKEKNHGVYINYSKGFVPPSVSELFRKSTVPNLDPSKFNNYELGGFMSFLNHKLYIDAAVYYLDGKDEIVSVRTIDTATNLDDTENKNSGATEHYGVEAKIVYKLTEELTLRNSGSISRHKYKEFATKISNEEDSGVDFSGNDIPGAPEYINNLELSFRPTSFKGYRLGVEWQALGKYDTDNDNTISYGGYHLMNLRNSLRFEKVQVWVNILNVFNTTYATRASTGFGRTTFTPGNPRNITLGLQYSF